MKTVNSCALVTIGLSIPPMQLAQIIRRNLCQIADAYAAATGQPRSVVSRRFYGRSDFLDDYRRGRQTMTVDKLDSVLCAFRREWPDDADWPFLPAIFMDKRNGK